jgi:hypothetical protein
MRDRNKQLKLHKKFGCGAAWAAGAAFTLPGVQGQKRPKNAVSGMYSWALAPCYQRASTAPQVNPPPIASISTRLPSLTRCSSKAWFKASGIEAADVLP